MFKKARVIGGILGMTMLALFAVCTKDNPVQPGVNDSWKISGNVQDGYTGVYIDSAMVEYPDRNGKIVTIATTKNGDFTCPELPYGNVTITVKRQKGTIPYTTTVLTIPSGPKVSAIGDTTKAVYKFRDTSFVVKLFSLNGTVTGTVKAQKHPRATPVVGAGVPVKITFDDPDMQYASPRTFNTMTDSNGAFKVDTLPLATKAVLTVLSATVGGVTYNQKIDTLADLTKGSISAGTIVLDMPVSEMSGSTKFRILSTNFPNLQILPNGTMTWTLSGKLDSSASYAVIQPLQNGDLAKTAGVTKALYSASGNIFSVTPASALVNGQSYYVTVYVYGDLGGCDSQKVTVTVHSVGSEEVVASNVLTATKDGISGLGLNDSMSFKMKDSLIQATASVSHLVIMRDTVINGSIIHVVFDTSVVVDLVTVTVSGNNVLIKPKGSWLPATPYLVNVFGTLADGTPVSFQVTVTTEGKLDFATSNVFDPQKPTQGKNGFQVKDSIVVTANKQLSAASAILTVTDANGTQVPVKVSVNGSTVVVKPQMVLNFATTYYLQFSMTSTTGEVTKINPGVAFETVTSGFYFVSSNACIGGDPTKGVTDFDPAALITVTMSDSVGTATASLKDGIGNDVIITTTVAGPTITIMPKQGPLGEGMSYSLSVTASSTKGVRTDVPTISIVTRTELYVAWTNVRMGTDANVPVLNFDPLDNIKVVMSKKLAKATAQVIDSAAGTIVYSTVSIKTLTEGADTLIIDPQTALIEGRAYNIIISVEDVDGLKYNGTLVMGLRPVKGVFIVASNVQTKDQGQLNNVPINTTPWYKLSVAPVASTIKATVTGTKTTGNIDNTITVKSDTLFVAPSSPFHYGETIFVSFNGMATNGKSINLADTFTCMPQNTIRVIWSNVLNANLEGITGVAINQPIKVLLSSSPKSGTITQDSLGALGHTVITQSGDTIIVTPVTNLAYGTKYRFSISGNDVNGNAFSVSVPPVAATGFQTTQNVFVVASNLLDANGVPLKTFPRYGAMWIKFSEAISTVKSQYTWTNYAIGDAFVSSGAFATGDVTKQIIGEGTPATPNATVRISNDTLFVTPDNRIAIGYGDVVGFDVQVTTALGKTKTFGAAVKTAPLNLYVVATNTKDANGVMREDFGLRDTVWVKSSVAIDSLIAVNDVGATTIPDATASLLRARTWLSASKDTIFYAPSAKLTSSSTYGLNFNVRLTGEAIGTVHSNVLGIAWKTSAGVLITAINNMVNSTTFRPFSVLGDSVVVSFSKAIDTSYNAPTPFAVSGLATRYTKSWSANLKTVTIKNLETLTARSYSINMADMTTNNTVYDDTLTFNVTCADGEEKGGLAGSNQYIGVTNLKTEYKLALIGTNTINGHSTAAAINPGTDIAKDTFALAGTPMLTFSRAVDTAKIKVDAGNQFQNYIQLKVNGASSLLQFTLAFSSDAKTITVTPVNPLIAGTKYQLIVGAVSAIPAIGLKPSDGFVGASADADKSILTGYDFQTVPAPVVDISNHDLTIKVDTVPAGTVYLNRFGYSAGYTAAQRTAAGIQDSGVIRVRVTEFAWNANHADSVTFYQFRVRSGSTGDFNIMKLSDCAGAYGTGTYSTFNPPEVIAVNSTVAFPVDLKGQTFFASLLIPVSGAGYLNGPNIFNAGTQVQVQARAVKTLAGGNYSYSNWSNTVTLGDNVAPGDTVYTTGTAAVTATALLMAGVAGTFNNTGNLVNTGNLADSAQYINLSFPEDMDRTMQPAIAFYYGAATTDPAPHMGANSYWSDARTFVMKIYLPSNQNSSSTAAAGWYYSISCVGMKDNSGNTCQNTGNTGTAANLTPYPGAATAGNANIGGLHQGL